MGMDQTLDLKPWRGMALSRRSSFAKTRSPLVSPTCEMGCNVVEPSYMRPRRGIMESDDFLAKDSGQLLDSPVLPAGRRYIAALDSFFHLQLLTDVEVLIILLLRRSGD